MTIEEIKKEKEWYEKEIIELTKLSIHNNSLNPVQSVHLVDYQKNYLYLKEIEQLQQENQELTKQLEDLFKENRTLRKKIENCMTFEDYRHTLNEKIKLKNQQKEFISYLENEILELKKLSVSTLEEITGKDYLIKVKEEILSKYQEIIGGKDER